MDITGADGVHLGTVDKLTKAATHQGHHPDLSTGLVADIEGEKERLSANVNNAPPLEEGQGGEGIGDGEGRGARRKALPCAGGPTAYRGNGVPVPEFSKLGS